MMCGPSNFCRTSRGESHALSGNRDMRLGVIKQRHEERPCRAQFKEPN